MTTTEKTYNYVNGTKRTLQIKVGVREDKIDDNTFSCLDLSMSGITLFNIKDIINCIRVILNSYHEEYLYINYTEGNNSEELVFENKNLVTYNSSLDISEKCKIVIEYNSAKSFNTKLIGEDTEKLMQEEKECKGSISSPSFYKFYIGTKISEILSIKELNKDLRREATLCELFKHFYKENPDFSNKDTKKRLQIMVYVLKSFNVINTLYAFANNKIEFEYFGKPFHEAYLPVSKELEICADNLDLVRNTPKGQEIPNKEKIEAIGALVMDATKNDINELIKLAIILYTDEEEKEKRKNTKEDQSPSTEELDSILKNKFLQTDINKTRSLVDTINTKLR